jgi:hypothetical protein
MMWMRFLRCVSVASIGAVALFMAPPASRIVHADGATTVCLSSSHADAASYDGSVSGASNGGVDTNGYTVGNCVGLGQTEAIFQAGNACENAGIPAGLTSGVGYAVVTWELVWYDDQDEVVVGPIQQQYDCGDTFS